MTTHIHDNTNLWLKLIQIWPPQDASLRFPSDNFTAKRCTQVTRYHAYSYHLTRILSFLMFSDNFLTFLRELLCVYRGIYNILPFPGGVPLPPHILSFSMNIILTWLLNFCANDLSISTLPDSVGYICSRISPADTKLTPTVSHGQLHPVKHLLSAKPCPLRSTAPSISLKILNWMGLIRFASTACPHIVHSGDAAMSGNWLQPKPASWCSLCPCWAIQALQWRWIPLYW